MADIALVCASGGHLAEMKLLKEVYESHDHFFVICTAATYVRANFGRLYFLDNPASIDRSISSSMTNVTWLLTGCLTLARILNKEKPKIIISTGPSNLTVPAFYFGKLIGAKTIFVESIGRFRPSLAGRLTYPIADKLFVRHLKSRNMYGQKAEFHGGQIDRIQEVEGSFSPCACAPNGRTRSIIFVTAGSSWPFPRLIKAMDHIALKLECEVVMQIGSCRYKPKNAKFFDFCDQEELKKYYEMADIVVGHSSPGTLLDIVRLGTRSVLFPRKKENGEAISNNQQEHAKVFRHMGFTVADSEQELENILLGDREDLPMTTLDLRNWNQRLVNEIKEYVDSILSN